MRGFTVRGEHGFTACELHDGGDATALAGRVEVVAGTPALYAAIGDPVTGHAVAPSVATMRITAPDGTTYSADANTATLFARTDGGSLEALCVLQPQVGTWRIGCTQAGSGAFRAMVATVPAQDPLLSAVAALRPHAPPTPPSSADAREVRVIRWALGPFGRVVASALATQSLALDLHALVVSVTGFSPQQATDVLTASAGQAAQGVAIAIVQKGELVSPDSTLELLTNGTGSDGMTGWTIVANGGDGWIVQEGLAEDAGFAHCFGVSSGWCRKEQRIDLVAAGLSAAYLDTAPAITVTDWVAALAPSDVTARSSFSLTVRLLGADATTVMKELVIARSEVPPGGWLRIEETFAGYGAGVRFLTFEDGGVDPAGWDRRHGVKMTGAGAAVVLAPVPRAPPELVANGSGQDGMTGWTNTSPSGDPWTVETGPGRACPVSPGTTAFAVTSGTGAKEQVIDLVAAGYATTYLDTAPPLEARQWIASSPDCACTYRLLAELRDQAGSVIASVDSGDVQVPAAPLRFQSLAQSVTGYPAGLRSVRFEHRAAPAAAVPGQAPAKITGASVRLAQAPGVTEVEDDGTATGRRRAVVAAPVQPVLPTNEQPYWWIARLLMSQAGARYIASGWLIPAVGGSSLVVTAAHIMLQRWPLAWTTEVWIDPAFGGQSPYTRAIAAGTGLQFPIEYLIENQAEIAYQQSYDYALLVPGATNWRSDGFRPIVEQDAQLSGQRATIAGYPGNYPQGHMYRQDVELRTADPEQLRLNTNFGRGSSGGPAWVRGTTDVTGIMSHGFLWNLVDPYLRRVTPRMLDDVQRWSTPLSKDDRVCSLQVVIHTGDHVGAGTSDPIRLTIDGHAFDLDPLWMPESGKRGSAKAVAHFDGYDLSAPLLDAWPGGLRLRDLIGKPYELRTSADVTWFGGAWQVESLNFFVNGHFLGRREHNRWIYFGKPGQDHVSSTVPG